MFTVAGWLVTTFAGVLLGIAIMVVFTPYGLPELVGLFLGPMLLGVLVAIAEWQALWQKHSPGRGKSFALLTASFAAAGIVTSGAVLYGFPAGLAGGQFGNMLPISTAPIVTGFLLAALSTALPYFIRN
jgi:hypothetical protein